MLFRKACHSPPMVTKHWKLISRSEQFISWSRTYRDIFLRSVSHCKPVVSIWNSAGTISQQKYQMELKISW